MAEKPYAAGRFCVGFCHSVNSGYGKLSFGKGTVLLVSPGNAALIFLLCPLVWVKAPACCVSRTASSLFCRLTMCEFKAVPSWARHLNKTVRDEL